MSFSSISIYRDLPIIRDFVQVPLNRDQEKTKTTSDAALDAIAGSEIVRLSLGSGSQTGMKCGQQEWLRLPAITPSTWYASDPVSAID